MNKTKQKILESAEKLFSEKGYDGTSIEDVTKLAGTTKALFFYYFKKKSEILHILMQEKINEAINDFIKKRELGIIPKSKDEINKFAADFIMKNRDISRIALFELLKTSSGINLIMDLPKEIFSKVNDMFEFKKEDEVKFIIHAVKTIIFISLRDNLCEKFELSEDLLKKIYNETIYGNSQNCS